MARTAHTFTPFLVALGLGLGGCSQTSPAGGAGAGAGGSGGTAGATAWPPATGGSGGATDAGDANAGTGGSAGSDAGAPRDASVADGGADAGDTTPTPAVVRMLHRVDSSDDAYIAQANGTDSAARTWIGEHWQRFEGFGGGPTPAATAWHPGGLVYFDTTAVNTGANPPDEHILKRQGTSERCYNPWGGNPNPQVTWNITSAATRAYLIDQMKAALAADAWSGLWLDDVNLDIGSSCVGPNDETWYTEFGSSWADTS